MKIQEPLSKVRISRKTPYIIPWAYAFQRAFLMGLCAGEAYTRDNNKIYNFNFSCNVKLPQIITTAQKLMVSPYHSIAQICHFHRK